VAVYCIGDIQGCHDELLALLQRLEFDSQRDRLWFTGDLVNRGPKSLDVLRFVKSLGDRAVTVLGNHDIHLLAAWTGAGELKKNDTLLQVLEAPDADDLLHWLRRLPLMVRDDGLGFAMMHAGLLPAWTLDEAEQHAREAEAVIGGDQYHRFFEHMYGTEPSQWSPGLGGWDRMRCIINAFTRMRYCDAEGRMLLYFKGNPGSRPPGHIPWFQVPTRKPLPAGMTLVTGHWSTLGFHEQPDLVSIDTGCLWGGELTAIQLDSPRGDGPIRRISLDCPCTMEPKPGA